MASFCLPIGSLWDCCVLFSRPLDFAAIVTNFWARIVAGNGAEMEPSCSKLRFWGSPGHRSTLNALGSDTLLAPFGVHLGIMFDDLWRHLESKVIVLVNLFLVCWLSVKSDFRFAWEAQHVKTYNVVAFRGMVYPQSSSISITTYNSWHFFNTGHDRARTVTTICAPPGGRLRATQ